MSEETKTVLILQQQGSEQNHEGFFFPEVGDLKGVLLFLLLFYK